ncbi:butyrophilin subfamily 3 member A3-like [Xyrichtys novacula]|uniref:Butyrophilin subfamily 3 member A3-like n=1 Tax=Xyrichtys novacula TaxID=13765 RepID=A0AAV1H815_XYRNO|nr:butyrophilin subfamily 3 member A3-like [Xyrichtys novacula]
MNFMWQLVFLLGLLSLQGYSKRDEPPVYCKFMETCILPCRFPIGEDVVVHWKELKSDNMVLSYYSDQEQPDRPAERFRGRTSLFKKVSEGDASLQLRSVKVQDEGRYECYTSSATGSAKLREMDLKVEALPGKVNIQQEGNKITCSAEGVYPSAEFTWSTSPPVTLNETKEPTVQRTEQWLYNISSFVLVSDDVSDVDYSCTIRTQNHKRRATLFRPTRINSSNTETMIPCTENTTGTAQTKLTWRFNHSEIILNQTTANIPLEKWKKHVKSVSETGDLILQDLTPDQDGVYRCELSTAEETWVRNTFLKVIPGSSHNVGAIAGGVIGTIIFIAVLIAGLLLYFRERGDYRPPADQNH